MVLRAAAAAALLAAATLADLPIHCTHTDILGEWELMLGESDSDSSTTCGHVTPDRIMTMVKNDVSPANPRFAVKRTLLVELQNPNKVIGPDGTSIGTWTMIYDEAFDITLDGWNYFTFFRYTPKSPSSSPTKAEDFVWHCGETVSGWYHLKASPVGKASHSWGCFVAQQKRRAVALSELSEEQRRRSSSLVSGEVILSATVRGVPRFTDAELASADAVSPVLEQRQRVSSASFSEAERADGGRASVDESVASLLRGGEDASVFGAEALAGTVTEAASLLEVAVATETISSDSAIRGLATADSAARIVAVLNTGDGGARRLWRAELPAAHLLGMSDDEARKRLGASSKDVRASIDAARRGHAAAAARNPSAATGAAGANAAAAAVAGANAAAAAHGTVRVNRALLPAARQPPHGAVTVPTDALPKWLDWSRVSDGAYIPDVLDQGHCGSCYAAASTDALTARARIRARGKLNQFSLSTQSVVQCSGHNQGCDGGYPYLVGKFGKEIGFVPDECMRYTARQDTCPASVDCPQLAAVADTWRALSTAGGGGVSAEVLAEAVEAGRPLSRVEAAVKQLNAAGLKGSVAKRPGVLLEVGEEADAAEAAGPLGFALRHGRSGKGAGALGGAAVGTAASQQHLPQFRADALADAGLDAGVDATSDVFSGELADAFGGSGISLAAAGAAEDGTVANTYALADRLYVSRYDYVGGFYGACSESAMMKELQGGPLVVALNAPGDLFYYGGGIYHHNHREEADYDVTPISRFEKTNHAVMLVGYGEERVNGQVVKYWKLKNSWGRQWGEPRDPFKPHLASGAKDGGYFRLLRGQDILASESMAVVIDP